MPYRRLLPDRRVIVSVLAVSLGPAAGAHGPANPPKPSASSVFIIVSERAQGAKGQDVPSYVTESSYPEMIPGRTDVGDLQEKRTLAILDLDSGKSLWADASFAGKARQKETATDHYREYMFHNLLTGRTSTNGS